MRNLRPMQYDSLPCQLEGYASVKLVLPLLLLVLQFVREFSLRTARAALSEPPLVDPHRLLASHRLADHGPPPADYFHHVQPRPRRTPTTVRDLLRLAAVAEDLASPDGSWRQADIYEVIAHKLWAETRRRARAAASQALELGGMPAAQQLVGHLTTTWREQQAASLRTKSSWSQQSDADLRAAAEALRSASRPKRPAWRILQRLFPQLPSRFWLTDAEKTSVATAADTVASAAQRRHALQVQQQLADFFERLLGTDRAQGLVVELLSSIPDCNTLAGRLTEAIPTATVPRATGPHEIYLVSSLDDVVDDRGTTVRRIFYALAAASGASPKRLAQQLWRDGLKVGGHRLRPGQWHDVPPQELGRAILAAARVALGLADYRRLPNPQHPQSAYDYFGQLRLLHPALRTRVQGVLVEWARRTRPYLDVPPLAGVKPRGNAYLWCAAEDRATWKKLLATECAVLAAPDDRFDLPHGSVAVLTQTGYGYAAQALPSFLRGLHAATCRDERGAPTLPSNTAAGEIRRLTVRPDDPGDVRQLLAAAQKGKVVRVLTTSPATYVLARHEPSVKRLFFEHKLVRLSQTATFFQGLLRNERFLAFVEIHAPGIDNWTATALALADLPRPRSAAERLVELGVLERNSDGTYHIAGPPPASLRHAPRGLYDWRFGRARGLTEEALLESLRDDDNLYRIMFWHVMDAWIAAAVTEADVPEFLGWFRQTQLEAD